MEFKFDRHVSIRVPEIKLVHNDDPLVLVGADALASLGGSWKFQMLGYDADEVGVICFNKKQSEAGVQTVTCLGLLLLWPLRREVEEVGVLDKAHVYALLASNSSLAVPSALALQLKELVAVQG